MDPRIFHNPPKQFRPAPFWSWNDDLQDEELEWQVRDMKDKGFGGYFMHSREGLITEYMSEAWMQRIATCIRVGKEVDMESWLYDEDRWPSGFAGGIVPARNKEYRISGLSCERVEAGAAEAAGKDATTVALFALERDSADSLSRMRRRSAGDRSAEGGEVWRFYADHAPDSNRFNGHAYVDLLNPEVTEEFLRCTHDAYHERFGKDFGEFVPGIFTDEPNYSRSGALPWTRGLPEFFRNSCGYDLVEKLPLLFFDGPGACKVRYDFWKTATLLFVVHFTRLLFDRCRRHGYALAGHFLAEDTLLSQTRVIGAAMPHYEYMQVPGIDHLGRNIANPMTLKQVSSAAHQFGRNRILCEIFGTSGHSMSFEDQKWIADWHFALGITFIDQHLTLYSMKGDRKRDYPPTFSYHQPYWEKYRFINDYFSRCSYALSQGRHVCDILLLHPIASAWATFRARRGDVVPPNEKAQACNDEFAKLIDLLLSQQRDFDLGDELILAKYARVADDELHVGQGRYRLVVMPPSLNWSGSTVRLLEEFLGGGGKLVLVGERPSLVNGEPSDALRELLAHQNVVAAANDAESLRKVLDALLPPLVELRTTDGAPVPDVFVHQRRDNKHTIYFFANRSREKTCRAVISFEALGAVQTWSPVDGTIRGVMAQPSEGDQVLLRQDFPPAGSLLLVVDDEITTVSGITLPEPTEETTPLEGPWAFERTHPNSLTLDVGRVGFDGEDPGKPLPVWKVRYAAHERYGIARFRGMQPWRLRQVLPPIPERSCLRMLFQFEVADVPRHAALVIEQARRWKLRVNGRLVATETADWHWDKQFGRVDITGVLREGSNEIDMEAPFRVDTEIEDIYLIGDFACAADDGVRYRLVKERAKLDDGDWAGQGYPFYAGNMTYRRKFRLPTAASAQYALRLKDPKGALFHVRVNGSAAGEIAWQPWEIDVTSLVRPGDNDLEIKVYGTLRNTFGPLHHKDGDSLSWVGPGQFVDEKNWTDEYRFAPYGLMGGAELVIRR